MSSNEYFEISKEGEKQKLNHQLESLKKTSDETIAKMQKELDVKTEEINEYRQTKEKTENELVQKLNDVEKQSKLLFEEKVRSEAKLPSGQVQQLLESLKSLESSMQLEKKLEQLEKKLEQEHSFKYNTKMESVLVERDSKITELEQKVLELNKELAREKLSSSEVEPEKDKIIGDLREKESQAQVQSNTLQTEVDHHLAENINLVKSLDNTNKEMEKYKKVCQELDHSKQVVIDKSKKVEELEKGEKEKEKEKESKQELITQVEEMGKKIKASSLTIKDLKKNLTALQDFYMQFEEYIEKLRSDPDFPQVSISKQKYQFIDLADISSDEDDNLDDSFDQLSSHDNNEGEHADHGSLKYAKEEKSIFSGIVEYIDILKLKIAHDEKTIEEKTLLVDDLNEQVAKLNKIKQNHEEHLVREMEKNIKLAVSLEDAKRSCESETSIKDPDDVVEKLEKSKKLNNDVYEFNKHAKDALIKEETESKAGKEPCTAAFAPSSKLKSKWNNDEEEEEDPVECQDSPTKAEEEEEKKNEKKQSAEELEKKRGTFLKSKMNLEPNKDLMSKETVFDEDQTIVTVASPSIESASVDDTKVESINEKSEEDRK
ncbi:hypothetical protein KGF56_002149 [Candida oxycetoniae]|uniref:Uncharacterized protein n=1 Tax=Candida oxycetoniae TaxID=497107 RepID=A0AAI9SYM3_9ASCO|nr:uncharacterized protein KGF56_002149 [Candida oxycetoniae]KAI3405064.2 hypothetical protein KGF56_002149 [Candida oxycetoniae]